MSDGRRHSIDVPLSRTLVALRRVKSLRDPSTNSMSKYSSVLDNYTWDTDSCNGISLGIENSCRLVNHSPLGSRDFGLGSVRADFASDRERANSVSDQELDSCLRTPDSKSISARKLTRVGKRGSNSTRSEHVSDMRCYRSNGDEKVYRNESFDDRHEHDHRDKIMDLVVVPSSNINCDDLDLYGEPTLQSARLERNDLNVKRRKPGHNKRIKSSGAVTKIIGSVECSPIPSISESRMDASSRSPSIFAHDEVDIVDDNYRGCGIGCCWSRTPRYRNRESGRPSDIEDRPLLSGEGGEACVHHKSEIVPYSDSPRSLSHKFRPRSFDELVGQNLVAHSLLNALSKGKITSFYLFHGPRGTGKTSTSRIFAAALNCLSLECRRPCGLCRECMLFFSGRSRDVKEVDPAKINRTDRVRSLLKSAARPPITSRFKVYIIDECQLLLGKTWATVLNSLDNLPQHVVFVLITADLDTVPRSALSLCQRYHFPMIKDADIVNRLTKICVEEGLEIEKDALDFIADKSNGSLRDAEMILDQLSLLGRRITISSAYELIGIVSDEELLNLLDLALSSDTSNTVRRARELMRSRVDPMQLISQLANLIMDILAGKFERGTSEVGRNFFGMHSCEYVVFLFFCFIIFF
ncbi:hypothetical protein GIB67_027787 [Kingdonia uniflora]|uniref:DNA-directed DNA polymerase n=1 Tax=Kingdonia uniflora TaxID=39325 RepID=A0A7J7PC19_9MAGN|nr:hypothetical protein GIB67_027787 [Kingdonia uniflora]